MTSRILLLSLAFSAGCASCGDETEPDPTPIPSATVEPSATTTEVDDPPPEPSAAPSASASTSVPKGKPGDPTGIAKCCVALHQNAKNGGANEGVYLSAAALCDSARSNPQARNVLVQIRTLLKGANVPNSCQ